MIVAPMQLRSEVIKRMDPSIELLSKAMKSIPTLWCKEDGPKFMKNPIKLLKENLDRVVISISNERDVNVSEMDFKTPIIAEAGPKRSFTVALLMMFLDRDWRSVSFKTVYDILIEETYGRDFNVNDLFADMIEPNLDRDLYPSDTLISALVVYCNSAHKHTNSSSCKELLDKTARSHFHGNILSVWHNITVEKFNFTPKYHSGHCVSSVYHH